MEESILKVERLSHRYSVQWAVRDISLEISKNGIYGLLGSNGAGKSTMMNIICGVLKQTEGSVHIKGINMRENPVAAKRHIGFLPQQPPLQMDLTVEEYLEYCSFMRDVPSKEVNKAIDKALDRCGIAQAIIHEPAIVVLDEPTNGLDPNQIVEVRHLIKDIAQDRTVILSTHILPEVQATCEYIRMIEQGTLVFSGSVDEFDNYIVPSTVEVSLIARPPVEDLRSGIPGVLQVEELGGTRYRLHFADAQEALERVAEVSATRGWRLNELNMEKSSLDAIFAELSKK